MADGVSKRGMGKKMGDKESLFSIQIFTHQLPVSTFHFPKYLIPSSSEPLLKSMTYCLAKLQPPCQFITIPLFHFSGCFGKKMSECGQFTMLFSFSNSFNSGIIFFQDLIYSKSFLFASHSLLLSSISLLLKYIPFRV